MSRRTTTLAAALAAAAVVGGAAAVAAAPPTPGTFYFDNGVSIEDAYVQGDGFALFCDIGTGSAVSRDDGAAALVTVQGNVWTVLDEYGQRSFAFGSAGDVPLCGNFDGEPGDEVAVRRDGNRYFLASRNVSGGGSVTSFRYGRAIDLALVGDWDGDGVDTLAVRSLVDNRYFFAGDNAEGGGTVVASRYGTADMRPTAGDFYGDGYDSLAVQQSFTGSSRDPRPLRTPVVHVSSSRAGEAFVAEDSFGYGRSGDAPVSADIDGDGVTDVGVLRIG